MLQPSGRMEPSSLTLVCFAVKEEASHFQKFADARPDVRALLTGIGRRNADRAVRSALATLHPTRVLSCGSAGALRPDLVAGTVLFTADPGSSLETALLGAGAQPGCFHCVDRVATTAEEKRDLWQTTGADAVEMESQTICAVCREHKIPCAIVRVILDTVNDDLPLDFNRLRDADQRIDYLKLALALLRSPGKIGSLRRLQKQCDAAAKKLAEVLVRVVAADPAGRERR